MYLKGKGKLSHLLRLEMSKEDLKFNTGDEEDSQIMSWLRNSMQLEISRTYMFLSIVIEIWGAIH